MKTYFYCSPRGFANESGIYYALPKHKNVVKKLIELSNKSANMLFYRVPAKEIII